MPGKKKQGGIAFTAEELERYSRRYDQIVATGREQNRLTKGRQDCQERGKDAPEPSGKI